MFDDSDRDKLKALAARINQAQKAADPVRKNADEESNGANRTLIRAVRIGSDFVATVMVSTGLGWFADLKLGTQPWGMLVMLLVGFVVGFWTIVRSLGNKEADHQAAPGQGDGKELKE